MLSNFVPLDALFLFLTERLHMKKTVVLLAILGMCTTAWAGITLSWTATDLGSGFTGYDLKFVGDSAADIPSALDIGFTGNFSQKNDYDTDFEDYSISTPFKYSSKNATILSDTHFINCSKIDGKAPTEDNNLAGSAFGSGASGWGMGTTLSAAYGIMNQTSQNYYFAHIVVPTGESFLVSGIVADGKGVKTQIEQSVPAEGSESGEGSEGSDDDESNNDSEETEGSEGGEDSESSESNDGSEGTDDTENNNNSEDVDDSEGTEDTAATEDSEITEDLASSGCTGVGLIVLLAVFCGFGFVSSMRKM